MNLLFVSTEGKARSPTAEVLFKGEHDTASAGTASEEHPVTGERVRWARIVFVMEQEHKDWLLERFAWEASQREIVVLEIPRQYSYGDSELQQLLIAKVQPILDRHELPATKPQAKRTRAS